jgi:hypothetical protein
MINKMAYDIMRQMVEICPWRIGQRVTVKSSHKYVRDFPGVWVITGLRWECQRGNGEINVEIACDDDIQHGHGATDGWRVDDFDLAPRGE